MFKVMISNIMNHVARHAIQNCIEISKNARSISWRSHFENFRNIFNRIIAKYRESNLKHLETISIINGTSANKLIEPSIRIF